MKEEKMDNREKQVRRAKSPVLAAILSAFFPGSGFFATAGLIKNTIITIIVISLIFFIYISPIFLFNDQPVESSITFTVVKFLKILKFKT